MGNGFGGVLKYDAKDGSVLLATNCASKTPAEMGREMRLVANSNSKCKKPVFHTSLSLPKSDKLTNEQWQKVGERYLDLMKFEGHQFSITRHTDSKHDHIHICVNRINLETGRAWSDSNSKYREMEAIRKIEKEFELTKVDQNYESQKDGKMAELRTKIDSALILALSDYSKFKADLEKSGVKIIENKSENTGRVSGLSFQIGDSKVFKGSQIGKTYSVNGLQNRGLEINQDPQKQAELSSHNSLSHLPTESISSGGSSSSFNSHSLSGQSELGKFGDFRDQIRANAEQQARRDRARAERER